jgi:hypothetical protein
MVEPIPHLAIVNPIFNASESTAALSHWGKPWKPRPSGRRQFVPALEQLAIECRMRVCGPAP